MDLKFDGVYRMVLIGEFQLPSCYASWDTILGLYMKSKLFRPFADLVEIGLK